MLKAIGVLILFLLGSMFLGPAPAFAQSSIEPSFRSFSNSPPAADAGESEREAAQVSNDTADGEVECVEGDRACRVNRQVTQIENLVTQTREDQKKEGFWDLPDMPEHLHGGKKVAMYIISVPTTYVARVVTWPMAVVADYLIRKGVVRKVVDTVSNEERTFWIYPRLELGFGNGFGGGVGVRHYDLFHKNYQFFANYLVYVNLDQRGQFGFIKPDAFLIAGKPFGYRFETKLLHDKDENFYGIGNDSSQSNNGKYGLDSITTGGALTFEPMKNLLMEGDFYILADASIASESPPVQTLFPANELPGFGRDLTYAVIGLSLSHDTRDADGRPQHGGLRRGTIARFQGLGKGGYDFNLYMLELEQFITPWLPRHTFGFRFAWQYRQPTGTGEVPFYHMARLDVYSPVRGFAWGRFRDRGNIVFNVSYRFPVWDYLDGEFFFDTGRVFHEMSDISLQDLKFTGGGGLLFSTKNYFLLRAELAYGGEGVRFLFKTSQAF